MKKDKKSPEAILHRAKDLFARQSYPAALQEYKKLPQEFLDQEGLSEAIQHCEQHLAEQRAKDLRKKAKRMLKKGETHRALECFEQAQQVSGAKDAEAQLAALRLQNREQALVAAVAEAAAAGDFLRAALLLEEVPHRHSERLRYLVLGEAWQEALRTYQTLANPQGADHYYAGFARAKLGQYAEAVALWEQVPSTEPAFLAHKKHGARLYLHGLYERLAQGQRAEAQEHLADLAHFFTQEDTEWQELLDWCHNLHLAQLWQEGKMQEIMATAAQNLSDHPSVLEIYAKAGFQCLEGQEPDETEVCLWLDYWLAALFHPFVRQQLRSLQLVEDLLTHAARSLEKYIAHREEKKWLFDYWQNNLSVLRILKGQSCWVPALAIRLGKTAAMCKLIEDNEAAFPNQQAWLAAGAAYSPASLALQHQQHEEALHLLDQMQAESSPFATYTLQHVPLVCAQYFIACERYKEAQNLFVHLLTTFPKDLHLGEKILEIVSPDGPMNLQWTELGVQVCTLLHKQENSLSRRKRLSWAITQRVLIQFKNDLEAPKILCKQMEWALALDPEDMFTQKIHEQMLVQNAIAEMQAAFDARKINKMVRIARTSPYAEVQEYFYEIHETLLDELVDAQGIDQELRTFALHNLLQSASKVDPEHPIIEKIRYQLEHKSIL